MERRGGFRVNPMNVVRETLDRLTKRRAATSLRGVYVSPDALIDDWIEIGGSTDPFQNSWVNFGAGHATAAYRKDGEGTVYLKGLVKNGTVNTAIFTLPVGYRPKLTHLYATVANGALGRIDINASGIVKLQFGSNGYVSILASFPAEQ